MFYKKYEDKCSRKLKQKDITKNEENLSNFKIFKRVKRTKNKSKNKESKNKKRRNQAIMPFSPMVRLEGLEPSIIDPKGRPENAKSSTFRIIFYHKISYQKSLNPFIFQHFRHFFLSNNTIQYFHLKIQHKHPVCKSLAFFLQKFVTF